jgi:hypothetical protein
VGGAAKRWVVNPTLALSSAQFSLRTRGEGGSRSLTFHPGLAGDWRELLRAVLIASEAQPGTPAERLRQKGIAADALPHLAELGVLVEAGESPTEVRFACDLDHVKPLPINRRRLELNPSARLVMQAEQPFRAGPTLLVDDPGTGIPMTWALGRKSRDVVDALLNGGRAPDRLPARWRSVLGQATLLVPSGQAQKRAAAWRRRCEQASEALQHKEHAVLRGLLHPLQLGALRKYMRGLRREGYMNSDSQQVRERVLRHNEPMARFYHAPLAQLINRFTPETTKPSYCFAAHYQAGAELKRHTDREQCVWNASFAVDASPETSARDAWPLFIESRGKTHQVRLGLGDAVLYSGTNNPHWRDPQPRGHVSTMVFYHFVPANFDGSLD